MLKHPAGENYTDFLTTVRTLGQDEWILFQNQERAFRKTLDTKHLEDKHNFLFSGETPTKWIRLIRILNGVYFENGTFTITRRNGRQFGLPFLKFTTRILKRMRVSGGLPEAQTVDSLAGWIEAELRFLRDIVQPALGCHGVEPINKSRWAKINLHIYGRIENLEHSKLFLTTVYTQIYQSAQIIYYLCRITILPNAHLRGLNAC